MGFSLTQPLGLLGLVAAAVAIVVWLRSRPPLSRGRAWLALGFRVAIIALVSLALAGLAFDRVPDTQALVVLADRSASVTSALDQEGGVMQQVLAGRQGLNAVGLVSFGHESGVEFPPDTAPAFSDFSATPNTNYTNIEAALRLAASLLPADQRRHLVVVTDGRQNIGDAVTEARLLRSQGARVDVIPLNIANGPEALVDSVHLPTSIPAGARAHARVTVTSNIANPSTLRVFVDQAQVFSTALNLAPASTDVDVTLPLLAPGFHTVRAELDPRTDTFTENNIGEALLNVLGTQNVLVVEGHPGAAANIVAAMKAASLAATVVTGDEVPTTAAGLANYQAVVLADVPANSLTQDRQLALQAAVRDLGLGLAAFGGADTFGPGGMAGTPIEATLPIDMQISDRSQKPAIAVMLVLESMESSQADAVMRSAAKAVVDSLTPRDFVGVTDGANGVAVPLQSVSNRAAIDSRIDSLTFGDPPSYQPFLQAAGDALAAQGSATRHIIILGDGDASHDEIPTVSALHDKGITTSAIGINVHGQAVFMASMKAIADAGKGRFYQSNDPSQVPQLLLQETQKGLKPWIVEERFKAGIDVPSSVLSGLDLGSMPPLTGYVASTSKAAAEVVLRSPESDPVLAQWQYGLGRVVAWTSDTEGRWTSDLLAWAQSGRFLANQVEWTLPLAADPALSVDVSSTGDTAHVIATVTPPGAGSVAIANVVGPDLQPQQLPLQGTGAGRFEGDFSSDQVGSYLVHVTVGHEGKIDHAGTAGLAIAYSPEYRFLGTDRPALAELARAGGGAVLGDAAGIFRLPVPDVQVRLSLSWLLLAIALVLLPLDIALRRLVFRRADGELWSALVRRGEALPVPAEATLGRLRGRIATHRDQQATTVQSPEAPLPREVTSVPAGDGAPSTDGNDGDLPARLLQRRRGKG